MHRDDHARSEVAKERRGLVDGRHRAAAGREEDDVEPAERVSLLGPQRRLAEVAEVRDRDGVQLEAEDRVLAALRSRDRVVPRGDMSGNGSTATRCASPSKQEG